MTDYNELKKLAEAATPGEWTNKGKVVRCVVSETHDGCTYAFDRVIAQTAIHDNRAADMAFIAAANPQAVSEMLAHISQLEQRISELEHYEKRFNWIEENCRTEGGGHGFTVFVPVDHEDIGCGIDAAIEAQSKEQG
jgi:hypothetical protein